ncbi:hypothetical protein FRC15_001243 [Serendipita sp. 397]|nr:hypothetical protein FRC15_001243 [Serendipita sp. 397]
MAVHLERRRREQGLFFTPVVESIANGSAPSSSLRSPTRRRAGTSEYDTAREAANAEQRIPRSSSSPLIYQVPAQVSALSSSRINHSRGNPVLRSSKSQSHLPRSRSQQLHQPPHQPLFTSPSPYSGSDADEDDEEDSRPLLVRRSSDFSSHRSITPVAALSSLTPTRTMVGRKVATDPPDESLGPSLRPSRSKTSLHGNGGPSTNGGGIRKTLRIEKQPIIIGINDNSIHWSINIDQVTPLLFQCLRTLAVIPAGVETLHHLIRVFGPAQANRSGNTRFDYVASAAWSILTAYQVLAFTTGLLNRWQHYYPLPATLVRLVGLQAICWPATFYTLHFLQYDGVERPLICWAVIGTTTCITRSIQMWVTSNIDDWYRDQDSAQYSAQAVASLALGFGEKKVLGGNDTEMEESTRRRLINGKGLNTNTKQGKRKKDRKWDWNEVVWKCAFPAGVCYFFMAWAMLLSRELYPVEAGRCG